MLIEKAPVIYAKGKEIIEKSGRAKIEEMKKTGGRVKGGFVEKYASPSVPFMQPPTSTQSQVRSEAPTSLSVSYNGPEYRFGECSYQGMTGLKLSGKLLFCSVEKNTTPGLLGLIKDVGLAGAPGDYSMQSCALSPVGSYLASTTNGRISMIGTFLYSMSVPFRKFRWKKAVFHYQSEVPTTTAGGVALAFTIDAADVGVTGGVTLIQTANYACSAITSVWDNAVLDCTPALDKTMKNMNPLSASRTTVSYDLISPGLFICIADSNIPVNTVCGKIFLEFEIELYYPGMPPSTFAASIYRNALDEEKRQKDAQVKYEEANKKLEVEKEKEIEYEDEFLRVSEPQQAAGQKKLGGFLSL